MITISRLYDSYAAAARAVAGLERAGIPHSDVSIIANNAEGWYDRDHTIVRTRVRTSGKVDRDLDGVDDRAEGAAAGAGIGAAVGGAAGLLAGLGLLDPRPWPGVAAGWLASTALSPLPAARSAAWRRPDPGRRQRRRRACLCRGRAARRDPRHRPGSRRRPAALRGYLDRSAVDIRERARLYEEGGWSRSIRTRRPTPPNRCVASARCAVSASITSAKPGPQGWLLPALCCAPYDTWASREPGSSGQRRGGPGQHGVTAGSTNSVNSVPIDIPATTTTRSKRPPRRSPPSPAARGRPPSPLSSGRVVDARRAFDGGYRSSPSVSCSWLAN